MIRKYLAIDPGKKRVGLAMGDSLLAIATPVGIVRGGDQERQLSGIADAIDEHQPHELVVGLPLNMDGTEGEAASESRKFAEKLQDRFGLMVHLVDERLSSADAEKKLERHGWTHNDKKNRRDALAAATFLQDFLDALAPPPDEAD